MPAKSKQQQKFMGLVHAFKKGEVPASKVSQAVKKAAKSMTKKSVKKYAKTDHDDLPVKVKEETKRDYKDEYKKFQSSKKSKKYRAELNKYNRQKGTYGNGDGKDASHKGGKIVGFESQSKNRGRAEKSRLKKEGTLNEIPGSVMGAIQTATIKNSKTGRTNKMSTALADKDHPGHKKAKGFFSKLMDKVKGKKKDDKKKGDKKMSDADAKAQAKASGISFRTGNELSKTEAVSKLREYVRGEIRKSLGKPTNEDITPSGYSKLKRPIQGIAVALKDLLKGLNSQNDDIVIPEIEYIYEKAEELMKIMKNKKYNEVNEGLLKEDVEDLKKIVKELEGASKMHLGQSKRIQAHLDSMNVDETSNANLRGEDRIKMLVRSGSINNKGSYKLKGNKLNVIGIRPRDKGFFVNQLTKNTGIRKANLYYDGVHWKDGNKKF
tara:strand:+ start:4325 stop:5632 length:1308 start_codon:yes stop_codon:yes gene_type:complete